MCVILYILVCWLRIQKSSRTDLSFSLQHTHARRLSITALLIQQILIETHESLTSPIFEAVIRICSNAPPTIRASLWWVHVSIQHPTFLVTSHTIFTPCLCIPNLEGILSYAYTLTYAQAQFLQLLVMFCLDYNYVQLRS